MKKLILFGTLLFLAGLSACVPSLPPLFTDKDLVYEPSLLGVWKEDSSTDSWTFERAAGKGYRLVVKEKGEPREFAVHLLKLDGKLFLDFYPEASEVKGIENDFFKMHLVPAHCFAKVTRIESVLEMAFLDPERLEKLLEQKHDALRHEKIDNRIVITDSTAKLQRFVLDHFADEKAFGDLSQLKRTSP